MVARSRRLRSLALLLVAVAAAAWWFLSGQGDPGSEQGSGAPEVSEPAEIGPAPDPGDVDEDTGLPWVSYDALPAEAHQTLKLIDQGGPFPYERDGITFGNFEGLLPERPRGYYREYTVPTPGLTHRGARRIVTGGPRPGEDGDPEWYFWTQDHYESFERIDLRGANP